jgi:large subunit ribosomal protein L25
MSNTTLVAETGRTTGSRPSNRLRAEGKIPGVVYGQGMDPVSVAVDRRELRAALSGPAGTNALITLTIDGSKSPVIVKTLQRDPVKRTVTHVDFLKVNLDEDIEVPVPVVLVGEAKAVTSEGGLVDPAMDAVVVRTRPANVPHEITIDITEMQMGDVIRIGDLTLPAGVVAVDDEDTPVVTVLAQQAEEVEEVEGGEAEEGGEAAEGAGEGE